MVYLGRRERLEKIVNDLQERVEKLEKRLTDPRVLPIVELGGVVKKEVSRQTKTLKKEMKKLDKKLKNAVIFEDRKGE